MLRSAPSAALAREAVVAGAGAFAVSASVAAIAGAARLSWDGGIAPGAVAWAELVLLSIPASLPIIAPAAGAVAAVAPLRRWTEDGGWTGVLAVGWRGRSLLPAWLAIGAAAAVISSVGTHLAEPGARREAREIAITTAEASIVPGVPLRSGELWLVAASADASGAREVFVAGPDFVGTASRARIEGGFLDLEDGRAIAFGADPVAIAFDRHREPLIRRDPRVELAERPTPELLAVAARTEAGGKSGAYERAVWWKRWLHPVAAGLLPIAVGPLGARRWTWPAVAAIAVGWLAAVRVGDHLAETLGSLPAASAGPLLVAAVLAVSWSAWRDR
jgi:lipopolysaccharide export LptBFGC system permease protein LptF